MTLCTEPTQITSGFLKYYDNPDRRLLPKERIFPVGQTMMLTDCNVTSTTQVDKCSSYKLTCLMASRNPLGGVGSLGDRIAERAKQYGIRLYPAPMPSNPDKPSYEGNINGFGTYDKFCWYQDRPLSDFTPLYDDLHKLYQEDNWAGQVDGYFLFPEEGICGLDPHSGGYSCFGGNLTWMEDMRNQLITYWQNLDKSIGQNLPNSTPEVESLTYVDFECWDKYGDSTGPERGHRYDALWPEAYVDRFAGIGGLPRLCNNILGTDKINIDMKAIQLKADSGYDRTRSVLLSYIFPRDGFSEAYWKNFGIVSVWMCGVLKIEQIGLWRATQNVAITGSRLHLQNGYYSGYKLMRDHDFDKAFLWGDWSPPNPISVSHTGTTTYVFSSSARVGPNPRVARCDIQFGNTRYLAFVNTHEFQATTVTISNLPTGTYDGKTYEIINCLTGAIANTQNSQSFTLTPGTNGVAIYKIRLRGWTTEIPHCDNTILEAPTVSAATTDKSVPYDFDDRAVITAEATGDIGHKWQARDKGETDWRDI